jgi:predicted NACHT family NTPase
MKKVAVLARQPQRHYEALRSSLGCLLENHQVTYLVLDYEMELDEAFSDNLGFLDEMEGRRFSNHPANVEKHGFGFLSLADMGELLREQDIVIPF